MELVGTLRQRYNDAPEWQPQISREQLARKRNVAVEEVIPFIARQAGPISGVNQSYPVNTMGTAIQSPAAETTNFLSGRAFQFQKLANITDNLTNGIPIAAEMLIGTMVEAQGQVGIVTEILEILDDYTYVVDFNIEVHLGQVRQRPNVVPQLGTFTRDQLFVEFPMTTYAFCDRSDAKHKSRILEKMNSGHKSAMSHLKKHKSRIALTREILNAAKKAEESSRASVQQQSVQSSMSINDILQNSLWQDEILWAGINGQNFIEFDKVWTQPVCGAAQVSGKIFVTNMRIIVVSIVEKQQPELRRCKDTWDAGYTHVKPKPGNDKEKWAYDVKFITSEDICMTSHHLSELTHGEYFANQQASTALLVNPDRKSCSGCGRIISCCCCCHNKLLKSWKTSMLPRNVNVTTRTIQFKTVVPPWVTSLYLIDRPVYANLRIQVSDTTPAPVIIAFIQAVSNGSSQSKLAPTAFEAKMTKDAYRSSLKYDYWQNVDNELDFVPSSEALVPPKSRTNSCTCCDFTSFVKGLTGKSGRYNAMMQR